MSALRGDYLCRPGEVAQMHRVTAAKPRYHNYYLGTSGNGGVSPRKVGKESQTFVKVNGTQILLPSQQPIQTGDCTSDKPMENLESKPQIVRQLFGEVAGKETLGRYWNSLLSRRRQKDVKKLGQRHHTYLEDTNTLLEATRRQDEEAHGY